MPAWDLWMKGTGVTESNERKPTPFRGGLAHVSCWRRILSYGIDLQGGKGNASNFPDTAPTLCAISHGTPNAVLLFRPDSVPRFPRYIREPPRHV